MIAKQIKVCILGAAFNTSNMGVSVLAAGALECVLNTFPEAKIIQLDYGPESYEFEFKHNGRPVLVRFVNIRFSKKIYLLNNIALLILLALASRLVPFGLRHRLLSYNGSLREVLETDIVLSVAGGDSFSDIYGLGRLLYVALPQLLALFAGKQLVLLPQTIGPFEHNVSKALAKYILTHAELIYSRDHVHERTTRTLMGINEDDQKLRFCYDLGFNVEPVPPSQLHIVGLPEEWSGESAVVGLNVSGLLMMGGYSRNNMFKLKVSYGKLVLHLIEIFVEQEAASILLIPHVSGTSAESDVAACESVFDSVTRKYAGKIGIVRSGANTRQNDYSETKYLIGRCDFFVGARMHACIGALSQTVPAISIAYSDKFIGVMESLGVHDLVVDPRKMDEDQIVRHVQKAFARRRDLRCKLQDTIPAIKQTINNTLSDVIISREGTT